MAEKSFLEWVNNLDGEKAGILGLTGKFHDVQGSGKLSHKSGGIYTWGKDSIDLTGVYGGDIHDANSAGWVAFLYLRYLKAGRRMGFETGPFENLWDDEEDE